MTLQSIATTYAAVVASVSLIWNIIRDRREQGRLLLSVSLSVATTSGEAKTETSYDISPKQVVVNLPEGERFFTIRFTNIGRRPLTLAGWVTGNTILRNVNSFTSHVTLNDSESGSFPMMSFDKLRGNVTFLAVQDTHGHLWKVPDETFKRMKQLMLEYRL